MSGIWTDLVFLPIPMAVRLVWLPAFFDVFVTYKYFFHAMNDFSFVASVSSSLCDKSIYWQHAKSDLSKLVWATITHTLPATAPKSWIILRFQRNVVLELLPDNGRRRRSRCIHLVENNGQTHNCAYVYDRRLAFHFFCLEYLPVGKSHCQHKKLQKAKNVHIQNLRQ